MTDHLTPDPVTPDLGTPNPTTGSAAGSSATPARWAGPSARRPENASSLSTPPEVAVEPAGWLRRHRRSLIVWTVVLAALGFRLLGSGGGSGPDFAALKVGGCLDLPDSATITKLTTIDCAKPHTREVYAIGDTTSIITITNSATQEFADPELVRICRTDVAPAILIALANTPDAQAGYLISSKRTGRVVCVAATSSRTGSLVADATGK